MQAISDRCERVRLAEGCSTACLIALLTAGSSRNGHTDAVTPRIRACAAFVEEGAAVAGMSNGVMVATRAAEHCEG